MGVYPSEYNLCIRICPVSGVDDIFSIFSLVDIGWRGLASLNCKSM
jgi:hypothetical protein